MVLTWASLVLASFYLLILLILFTFMLSPRIMYSYFHRLSFWLIFTVFFSKDTTDRHSRFLHGLGRLVVKHGLVPDRFVVLGLLSRVSTMPLYLCIGLRVLYYTLDEVLYRLIYFTRSRLVFYVLERRHSYQVWVPQVVRYISCSNGRCGPWAVLKFNVT